MFAGIENTQVNPRRGWTALVSFTLQAAAVALALVIPLLRPNSLPNAFARHQIFVPVSSPVMDTVATTPHGGSSHDSLNPPVNSIFVVHQNQFHFIKPGQDANPVDPPQGWWPTRPDGPGPDAGPSIGNILPPTVHPTLQPQRPISRPMQGFLIRRVEPIYPPMAIAARVEGPVIVRALISTDGRIEQAQVISGSPLLARAALDAIRQWRYRPYYLNDKPVEVETEVTVNFFLTR